MEAAYSKSKDFTAAGIQADKAAVTSKTSLARNILYLVYIIIPIAAGADKFFNLLTNWTQYINPLALKILPITGATFMMIVGVIEIAAGFLVLARPKIGAYVVSLWLVLIAFQLLTGWMYVDVAVRDLAMAAGAFCLGLLSDTE